MLGVVAAFGQHHYRINVHLTHHGVHVDKSGYVESLPNLLSLRERKVADGSEASTLDLVQAKEFCVALGDTAAADEGKIQHAGFCIGAMSSLKRGRRGDVHNLCVALVLSPVNVLSSPETAQRQY